MSQVRTLYRDRPPHFPATDQHPKAQRYGPFTLQDGSAVYADAVGGPPSIEEIEAVLPPSPDGFGETGQASAKLDAHLQSAISELSATPQGKPAMKPAAAGLNVKEMMEDHMRVMGDIHQAQISLLKTSLERQRDTVVRAVHNVTSEIDSQTDEFLSIMGQYTNDLG